MEVRIENQKLVPSINLLYGLSLKGKHSRHRTKFIKMLNERLDELQEQESELLKEHCHLDEDGNPKTKENGTIWDVKDPEAFTKDRAELYEEEMVIDDGNNQEMLSTVKDMLFECEKELSGQEAEIYDYLCDQFEEGEEE